MMKVFKILFISYAIIQSFSIMAQENLPINPSSRFHLDDKTAQVLIKQSFSGDAEAAIRLANYYNFYLTGDSNFHNACIWFYVSAILENKVAMHNLNYLVTRKKITLEELFAYFETQVEDLEKKNDTFAYFVLYKYFLLKTNPKFEKYLKLLREQKIDNRLLQNYTLQDGILVQKK